MQAEMLERKASFLQRQALSVAEQPPRLTVARHSLAQAGSEKDDSIK